MKKIDTLTAEQQAAVPYYLDKWMKIGHKTGKLDRQVATEAIKIVYENARFKPPTHVLIFESPLQCQLACAALRSTEFKDNLGNNLRNNFRNNIWDNLANNLRNNLESNLWDNLRNNLGNNLRNNLESNLWDNLRNNLGNNLRNNLWDNLRNNLGNNLRNTIWDNLWDNIWDNLWDNLRNNLWDNLGNNLRNNLGNNLGSNIRNNLENNLGNNFKYESTYYFNYWTYWIGLYDYVLHKIFPHRQTDFIGFKNHTNAVQNLHAVIPFEDVVILSDFPVKYNFDAQNRLHHETEPAMMYADGYSLFAINGIQVPKWAIETPKDQINPQDILKLENTEQRTCLMRFVGLHKFLEQLNAEIIHEYDGYKLYYLTVEGQKIGPYLYLICPSSGRPYLEGAGDPTQYEFIDTSIKTCQDALRWRYIKASKGLMTKFNLKWDYHA